MPRDFQGQIMGLQRVRHDSDFHFIDTEPFLQVWNKFHLITMYDPINILLNLS